MTNRTKWLVAVPFALIVGLVVPGLVAGDWLWFVGRWPDTLYTILATGMWLVATAFVDLDKPRGKGDAANALIPLGLILSVPVAVWDRVYGLARAMPVGVSVAAVVLSAVTIVFGITARRYLGPAYAPRVDAQPDQALICRGPYRVIRHPLYLAALMWVVAWPLILGSLVAPAVGIGTVLPAILKRMREEEVGLLGVYGEAYAVYQRRSWRLIPYLY
ncbi:MAG TPA: isoprenylcysteine carboxylmethyltransferase family protein [Anaerolineae bacterium]|nr:isoprenylcysteine carboxylmethyltransferase family protein [Anaerolineae bacterium]